MKCYRITFRDGDLINWALIHATSIWNARARFFQLVESVGIAADARVLSISEDPAS